MTAKREKQGWGQRLGRLFAVDLRSLALLRMGLGFIVFCDVFLRLRDLTAHYTDAGVLPRSGYLAGLAPKWNWSLHFLSGQWQVQVVLFTLMALAAFCLLVGWRTRLATVVTFLMVCSTQGRNPLLLQGGDILLRVVLFWCMFLPLGARASVDRVLASRAAHQAGHGSGDDGDGAEALPTTTTSVASVALFLQLALVYIITAVLKDGAEWRSDGTALYYALSIDQYATAGGRWLLGHPGLMTVLTHLVFWFEVIGPLALFSPLATGPTRTLAVAGFLVLHLSLVVTIDLGLFPWISSLTMAVFLPPWFWERVLPRAKWLCARVATLGRWLATQAERLGRRGLRGAAPSWRLGRVGQVLCALSLGYVVWWNLTTLPGFPYEMGSSARAVGLLTRIEQRWDMFAPAPMKGDGWYVIPGKLIDGREVDLFRGGSQVSWAPPAHRLQKNQRWRKYFMNLSMASHKGHRLLFGRYLCRSWNSNHAGDARLETLQIVWVSERTPPPGQPRPPEKRSTLWQHRCFDRSPAAGKPAADRLD